MASRTVTSTPTSSSHPPPAAPTPPPGTWQHPKLAEISRRRIDNEFDERKFRIASISLIFLLLSFYVPSLWPFIYANSLDSSYKILYTLSLWFIRLSIFYKGFTAVRPLFSKKDEMSDIALTPSQRALLGLGPTSAPATPGSAYVTPPRYLRSTSRNHSVGSSRAATVGSEGLDRSVGSGSGTPGFGKSTVWDSPIAGSPLARKAMGKRASLGMGASIGDGGSPSPIGQRNVAVGLSNKFLYQRRVASNGGMTNYV